MTLDMYTRAVLVRFALEEGQRHGGINNTLAILHVLRNRVFAGWGDWLDVLESAPSKRGTIYSPAVANFRSNDARVVLARVDEIYTRVDPSDLTGGAVWYCEAILPIEAWFKRDILDRPDEHRRVAHIGPVWFFT